MMRGINFTVFMNKKVTLHKDFIDNTGCRCHITKISVLLIITT